MFYLQKDSSWYDFVGQGTKTIFTSCPDLTYYINFKTLGDLCIELD